MLAATTTPRPLAQGIAPLLVRGLRQTGIFLAGITALAAAPTELLTDAPLAPRSGPRGATLFTELLPSQTGVITENNYADPAMWWERYHEFEVGAIGTGIAIGDYDGDSRPDIYVVSKTENGRLFRNLGNWKFEEVTAQAGLGGAGGTWQQGLAWAKRLTKQTTGTEDAPGIWKQGATWVDVNNDGRLDLYVCRFGAPNLLYINQGDGRFKEEAAARGLALNSASGMAAFCDYDRDGWLDVYIQTNLLDANTHPNGERDRLYHNNRDGTFSEVTDQAGISGMTQGHSATWWDYDNDGWPDLYVANDFATPDQLYHNNRDGTFTNRIDQVVPHTPFSSMGADLGDVDNDGRLDLLVADMAASSHEKDQRGMAESRSRNRSEPADSTTAPQYTRSALYLNTGTEHCLEAAHLTGLDATDWTWSVRFEDLDNDGRLDLHLTNGMFREPHNVDLLDSVMSAETPAERIKLIRSSPVFAETHFAFRNLGDLHFENCAHAWGLDQTGVSFGAAFGDFDGDGDLDLVYANYQGGVTLLRNDSDSGHRITLGLRGTVSNRFGVGATIRIESESGVQVRQLVLARGYLSSSEPMVHFGLGNDAIIQRLTVTWPSGHVQEFAHLPVDRHFTITEPSAVIALPAQSASPAFGQFSEISQSSGLSLLSRETVVDENVQQPLLPIRHNRNGPGLAIGDFNGDGADDIWIGGTAANPARIQLNTGIGKFESILHLPPTLAPAVNDGPALVLDFNGDGANDLLITKGGASRPANDSGYQPELLLNDGHGLLQRAPAGSLPALTMSAGTLTAADFNRDGQLDIFIGARLIPGKYPAAPRSALLVNHGGRFEDVTDSLAPGLRTVGLVTSALWSDVDTDGWPDLMLTLEWGQVKYFHNNLGRGFSDWTEQAGFAAAGTGWWTSLATADFNGDGRPDFVAGNAGLNTPYHASPTEPALLYAGDFKDGGAPQLIEAYHEGEKIFPWRTRKDLSQAVGSLRKRFPKNNDYAKATLGELVGEARLAAAQRFAATEFRSGVFLSQADGCYRFEALPPLVQIAPMQGVVAGDFDGDGYADIYAVQNSYAPIPSIGRFDGGLSQLLRGDGHGHFTPVPLTESGLLVPGDAKALGVFDLNQDGWPDFFVTRNNDTTLAFQNRGVAGRHSLRVLLHGPAGNPTGVGAQITLELSHGLWQTSEVQAGSGFSSQSAAACFFGWPENNPPRHIRVRWPSGTITQHEVSLTATTLVLSCQDH